MAGVCQAPGCEETRLCHAHIVPAGFARTLSGPGGHNKAIRSTGAKRAKQPHGEFDSGILCEACDAKLGRFDEYAITFCASLPQTLNARTGKVFGHAPFDGMQFARDARKFVFMPLRIRSGALNAFTIGLGGFLVWAKIDRRPTDRLLAPFVINAASELRAPIIRFTETAEYEYFQGAARRERAGKKGSAQ